VGSLPITGERTVPGVWHENYWFRRHEAVYLWARRWCAGAAVLEAGCGEGYGAELLRAAGARLVLGIDYDAATLDHVHRRYPGVAVVRGNLVQLPVGSGTLDLVVALQVIEHLWDQPRFVAECARVLRPGGTALISTPNRLTFPTGNVFHSRELEATELADVVGADLRVEELRGLSVGPRLAALDTALGGLVDAQLGQPPGSWAGPLADAVRSVRADDFVIAPDSARDPIRSCLDLIAVAVRDR
jgi:SAM-dependent methyltransferase